MDLSTCGGMAFKYSKERTLVTWPRTAIGDKTARQERAQDNPQDNPGVQVQQPNIKCRALFFNTNAQYNNASVLNSIEAGVTCRFFQHLLL